MAKRKKSKSTLRAYEQAWKHYREWCAENGRDPAGGNVDETVAAWLYAMNAAGLRPTTMKLRLHGVTHAYRTRPELLALKAAPARSEAVRDVLDDITEAAEENEIEPKQARPLLLDELDEVLTYSALRRSGESPEKARLRHLEAEATMRLAFDACMRADEVVRARWDHLVDDPHPKTGAICIRIDRTKTGKRKPGYVNAETRAALMRWRAESPDPDGRICTAPSAHAWSARVRRLGEIAGVEITGHSMRRGSATEAPRHGANLHDVQDIGGWNDPKVASHYVETVEARENGVSRVYAARAEREAAEAPEAPEHEAAEPTVAGADFDPRDEARGASTAALTMARKLGATRDHPAVAEERARFLRYWPETLPPPADCARPGCPGFVAVIDPRPGDAYCCRDCQQAVNNARRNARKREQRSRA